MSAAARKAFSRLETDAELLDRATAKAGHRVFYACCAFTRTETRTEALAEAHGCQRRLVWIDE